MQRHTHASIYSGEDVTTVAERFRNTPKVIWETYAHVIGNDKKKVTDVFAEALKNRRTLFSLINSLCKLLR